MLKKLLILLAIILVMILTIGVSRHIHNKNVKEKQMIETATRISQKYVKEHYDKEFMLQDYKILPSYISSTIFLHGNLKGLEDVTITVVYDYKKEEVSQVGGPGWFIDSRK